MNTKIKIFVFAVISAMMSACSSDQLDLVNPNALTASTAFTTEADMDASLTGIYHSFYSSYYGMMSSNQFSGQSDEMTSYSVADIQQYVKHVYSNMNQYWNSTSWNQLYEQVARCNQVITYAENITEWSKYNKDQIIAQARAIRAYDYYQLAMLYKEAPYVDYVAASDDQPAAGDFDAVCQKIIEDAKYAYDILPSSYKASDGYNGAAEWKDQYRVTKWFAACVLAKTYMNWGDYLKGGYHYSEALPYYKAIVETGGFALTNEYSDNFNIYTENNTESIFEIQHAATTSGWKNYYGWTNNDSDPSRSMWRWKFYAAGPLGWTDYNSDAWVLHAFKNEKAKDGQHGSQWDARIPANIFYADIFNDFPEHVQWQTWSATEGVASWGDMATGVNTPGFSWMDWNKSRVYINKYVGQYESWQQVNTDNCEGTNNRIFRLGEIMLDYAECMAQTGDLAGAVGMINRVRNRAGLCNLGERQNYKVEAVFTNSETNATSDFNSSEYGYPAFENNSTSYTLADVMAVLDLETMKESAFECERFVDLRRWGISFDTNFLSKVKKRSYKYNANFTPTRAWLPMPTNDVNNNPNLSQLEGW